MSRGKSATVVVLLTLAGCVGQTASVPPPHRTVVDLQAVLPPQALLREDTMTALTHDRSQSRLAYVGVWATDGDKCAMMDQTAFDGFAVITPDSIRQSSGTCTFEPGAAGDTSVRLDASCKARRKPATARTFYVQMLDSQTLALGTAVDQPATRMVRCRLQK